MYKSTGIIIQARTGSKRLPNKIIKKILPNTTFIEFLVKRLNRIKKIEKIIIATSNKKKDDKIFKLKLKNVFFFRGSETNVIKRYLDAAQKYKLRHIIRITADCPFVDPTLIEKILQKYHKGKYNYASNVNPPSFPNGFDIEIFDLNTLKKSFRLYKSNLNKEHVTFAIRKIMKIKKYNLSLKKNLNHIRLTLDNKIDLIKIQKLVKHINIADNWKSIYLKNIKINNEK